MQRLLCLLACAAAANKTPTKQKKSKKRSCSVVCPRTASLQAPAGAEKRRAPVAFGRRWARVGGRPARCDGAASTRVEGTGSSGHLVQF